jgi:uncharacterized Tic20 family protein
MNVADELEKLQRLRESGAIDEDEFRRAKDKILGGGSISSFLDNVFTGDEESQTRQWSMILHLSLLLCFSMVGVIVPILIWQFKKKDLPNIDEHGKNAVNWIISLAIYAAAGLLLTPVLIGYPILCLVGVAAVALPIIAAIKANNGEVWKYPIAIAFMK